MLEFYKTQGGRKFIEGTVPKLVSVLERVAVCLEKEQERQACVKEASEGVKLEEMDPDYLEALTESINTAAGRKAVEVVVDDADYWMGTWLFHKPDGDAQGWWERRYFKADNRQQVEDWMWGHDNGQNACGVYVEVVDFEIDTDWDIEDITEEGR